MRLDEFTDQMQRLQLVYGEKIYPEERKKIYWEMFRHEDATIFARVISKMIVEMHLAPPASKIKEALKDTQQGRRPSESPQAEYKFMCEPCRDFGYGFIGDLVVACTCDKGRGLNPSVIAEAQGHYNRGAAFIGKGARPTFADLPYDKNERIT